MNVAAAIRHFFRAPAATKSTSWAQAWLRGQEDKLSGGAIIGNAFQQSVWVYSCITAIAENLAQVPLTFVQGDARGENELTRGPIIDLFKRPHPQMSRFTFWEHYIGWLMLRGEIFIIPTDNAGRLSGASGRIDRLTILSPDRFWHLVENGELIGWRYTGAGQYDPMPSQVFLPEEVIFDRLANPFNFWRGWGPYAVASVAAQTDFASAQFMKGLMQNNADTGLIVATDQQVTDEQREQILAALKERKRAAGTSDRPLLLAGGLKIEKPGISSADLQFLENRKFNRQEICAVFRVPQEILGFTEDANRSVSESARLNFTQYRLAPLCDRIAATFEPVVQRFGPALQMFFDIDDLPVMQAARNSRADTGAKYFAMGVPWNDINRNLDLGFPEYPWGDVGYLPFNLQPASAAHMPPPAAPSAPGGPMPPEDMPPENMPPGMMEALRGLAAVESAVASRSNLKSEIPHVCSPNPEYEAAIAGAIRVMRAKLSRFFFEQRARTLAALDQFKSLASSEILNLKSEIPNAAAPQTRLPSKADLAKIFNLSAENAALIATLKPLQIANLNFGGAQLFAEIGLDDFKIPPANTINYLRGRQKATENINAETFRELDTSVADGLEAGETFAQLLDRVKEVFNDAADYRADRIAVTETNSAVNAGRFEAMDQAGVEKKGWSTSHLENSRPAHVEAEADYKEGIPLDEPFIVGGEELMFPGDPAGSPGNIINCRCFTFAVLPSRAAADVGPAVPSRADVASAVPSRSESNSDVASVYDRRTNFLTWEQFQKNQKAQICPTTSIPSGPLPKPGAKPADQNAMD